MAVLHQVGQVGKSRVGHIRVAVEIFTSLKNQLTSLNLLIKPVSGSVNVLQCITM